MIPLPSWWKPAAGIIAVLALAWYVDGCYEDRYQRQVGAAEAAREEAERSAEDAREALEEYATLAAARKDSLDALDDSLAESRERRARAEQRAEAASQQVEETAAAVDEAVQDSSLAELIHLERAAHAQEVQALRDQIGELEAQVVTTERQRDIERAGRIQAEDVARTLRVALEERTAEAERWREAAEPGFFEGFVDSFSQVGTTAVVVGIALLAL